MMARAVAYHAAHVQQMQAVAGSNCFRHVADETLERAPSAQHAYEYVARINLRQAARW